jgi:exodeoxyribonuclease VII large subunit
VAVAEFPLPVLIGIGHEQDLSVLDAVGRSCKTPTAAAAFVVLHVTHSMERLDQLGREILAAATAGIAGHRRSVADHAHRLVRAASNLLRHERSLLDHRQRRTAVGTRAVLASARDRLARWTALIPRDARVLLERQLQWLAHVTRTMKQTARHDLGDARERVRRVAHAVGPAARRRLGLEVERIDLRSRRLELLDPRRVLDRGYSILRLPEGRVVTRAEQARAGTYLSAELKDGRLRLRSEGSAGADGGE